MFDRSVRGLRSQGFRQARGDGVTQADYKYVNDAGMRCAWGWVDDALTAAHSGTVMSLGVGVAATLGDEDLVWARDLQRVHDNNSYPVAMEVKLRQFAVTHELVFLEAS